MTPQEQKLVSDLFDRLAQLESNPRDPDAEDLIAELWDKAPNASYALVQSVLVQDEALKRANARIQELEADLGGAPEQPAHGGSFLDGMREKVLGRGEPSRGSVPSVRPGDQPLGAPTVRGASGAPDSRWNSGATYQQQPQQPGGTYQQQPPPQEQGSSGGSFLGTAASAAAGVVGGALLMRGIGSLFGQSGSAHAKAFDQGPSGGDQSSPWGGSGGGELSKEAGLNDIGRSPGMGGNPGMGERAGLSSAADNADDFDDDGDADDFDDSDVDDGDVDGGDTE